MLRKKRETFSKLFFFLPSTTDKKEEINQHISKSACMPLVLSPSGTVFVPSDLENRRKKRKVAPENAANLLKMI